MKEYAIYPFKNMNISQNWNEGNHIPHWKNSKNYSDKPWDEAGKDSGREYFIPQNDFLIEEVLGLGNNVTNSVRLKTVNKIYMPYKTEPDYLCLTLTHMNEDNLKQVKVGQILKKGSQILLEGTDGNASGNHFHVTANLGKYYGLLKNSNDAWCYTYEKSLLPEEAFYIDTDFTVIKNGKGAKFKNVPVDKFGTTVLRNELVDQIEVLADNLRARSSANGDILGYVNKGIYNIIESKKVEDFVWYKVAENLWFAYSEKWAKIYLKKEVVETPEAPVEQPKDENSTNNHEELKTCENEQEITNLVKKIIQMIIDFVKKIFK